jgi:hypothetical protein
MSSSASAPVPAQMTTLLAALSSFYKAYSVRVHICVCQRMSFNAGSLWLEVLLTLLLNVPAVYWCVL